MITEGIANLGQMNDAVARLAPYGGGSLNALPPGQKLPSWSFFLFSTKPHQTLNNVRGLVGARLQIDAYGNTQNEAAQLAEALKCIFDGFRGKLFDNDQTYVDSCLWSDERDFPEDASSRTFRRMEEFQIFYVR